MKILSPRQTDKLCAIRPSKLSLLALSVLCLSAMPAAQAAEIDFLTGQVGSGGGGGAVAGGTNVLFFLDASSSMDESWNRTWLEVDPATQTSHPDVVEYNRRRDEFVSKLRNRDVIPSSIYYETNWKRCAEGDGVTTYGEGDRGGNCYARKQSWSIWRSVLAREAVRDVLPDLEGLNVGVLRGGVNAGGQKSAQNPLDQRRDFQREDWDHDHGAFVMAGFRSLNSVADMQGLAQEIVERYVPEGQAHIPGRPPQKSPLTESLLEAYWYLTSQKSLWNKDSLNEIYRDFVDESVYQAGIDTAYQGPNLDNGCSVSHVVMVTDGEPTWDWAGNNYIRGLTGAGAPTVVTPFNEADRTSDETLLDELADYMANTDLDTSKPGKQTVVTHFVSTWSEPEYRKILDVAVQKSGGLHVALDNIEELPEALAEIVSNLNGAPSNFRVYQTQLVQSENTPFESQDTAFVIESRFNQGIWSGVLKRFNSDAQGVVSDKNGVLLVDPTTNQVNQEAIDVWSSDPVAGSGQAPIGTRRYTLLQDQTTGAFLNAGNQLHQAQQQAILERLTGSAAVKQTTFNWLTGVDVQDVDSDGDATEVRSAFGDQINQKPEVVFTGRDDMTVYFGDNQGFLNAVDGKTGRHLYSFMPPEFLAKVNDLAGITTAQGKRYGIDGALKSFTLIDPNRRTRARKRNFLAFSFGKGGSGVYILDVTERDNPKLALRISAATPGFENMGEAWATPEVSYAETPDGKVPVALFGGGFSADNAKGGSVYVVNLDKSKLLWTVDQQFSQTLDQHRFPIVNKVTKLDSNQDGMTNAFFYNDVRGNIFRCDFNAKDANNALQCGQLASAQRNNEALSFYSPLDVALMKAGPGQPKLVLTQSSGDRLNPNSLTERDRLMVAIIDKPFTAPAALYDGSVEPIQGANLPELTAGTDQATLGGGWRFSFPNEGEKGFGKTLIFNNQLFLSTYQAGVLVAQPVALPAAKSTTVRPTRTSTAPTSAAATAPAATSATGPSASSRPAPPPRGASGRPVPPTNPLPSGSSVSITTSGSTSASGGTTGTSNSTSGAGSRVRECGTATTQGIARIYGFNLTSPTQGVGAQAAGAAQWVGPVRNLPDMPSVIRDDNSDMPVARINLGIDTTSIEVQYEPLQRQYWYEKPY